MNFRYNLIQNTVRVFAKERGGDLYVFLSQIAFDHDLFAQGITRRCVAVLHGILVPSSRAFHCWQLLIAVLRAPGCAGHLDAARGFAKDRLRFLYVFLIQDRIRP